MDAATVKQPRPNTKARNGGKPQQQQQVPTKIATRWDRDEFSALFARVVSIVGSGDNNEPNGGGGAFNMLPRLLQTYGGPAEAVEGVSRDIETGCRLASAAVLAEGAAALNDDVRAVPTEEDRARIRVALSALYYVNQAISASSVAYRTVSAANAGNYEDAVDSGEALAAGIARFSAPDPEETNRVQQLLLYLLNTAQVTFSLGVGPLSGPPRAKA